MLMMIGFAAGAFRGTKPKPGLLVTLAAFGAYAARTLLAMLVATALVVMGASRRWVLAASVIGLAVVAAYTVLSVGTSRGELFGEGRLIRTVGYYNGEAAFLLVPFWAAVYVAGSPRVPRYSAAWRSRGPPSASKSPSSPNRGGLWRRRSSRALRRIV